MLSRRTFGTASAFAAATLAALPGQEAKASSAAPVNIDPRGDIGRLRRMPKLEQESKLDFLVSAGQWINTDLSPAMMARANEIVAKAGIDPNKAISNEQAIALFNNDPVVGLRNAMWQSVHVYCDEISYDAFHSNADAYLAELETHDNIGPGSLTLDAALVVPEYARHEIHQQTGGYVGNAFAGHMYHADTNQFYRGLNDQDQRHASYAAAAPLPADGKVTRILDLGTGIGQLAVAMKDRFPDAEVHGIDVAAPMLRYGHMRAVNLKSDVHFKQVLAEKTGYPDNHFDMVVSYIMFHEVPAETTAQILKEVSRILRPGGTFYPLDFNYSKPKTSPVYSYTTWWDHRWNNERWRVEYASVDMDAALQKAGFTVQDNSETGAIFGKIVGVKSA
jgi:ubiquinone/menaquinone biosynthesis C-methylase UbiE